MGSWKAWLDGYGTTHTDTLSQQVMIPSTTTSATLSFWLQPGWQQADRSRFRRTKQSREHRSTESRTALLSKARDRSRESWLRGTERQSEATIGTEEQK